MLIRTLCLATSRSPALEAKASLEDLAGTAMRDIPGLRQVQVNRVLRQVPTDYIANDRPYGGVTAEADRITASIDLHFDGAGACSSALESPGWGDFTKSVRSVAEVLFMLDSEPNVPVPLRGAAIEGGFRRWLLLTRKAATREAFRDAWFGRHASLVRHLPQLDGYVQNLVVERYDGDGVAVSHDTMPIDGIAEVCFADEAAMNASYGSDARLPLRDDGRDLNARVSTLLVQGKVFR